MIAARDIRRSSRLRPACARRCGAWLTAGLLVAPAVAAETAPADARADGDIEEVVVTAERLEKGAVPTPTIIVQTYNVLRRGKRLYNERRYQEALPYLVMAAKRGFKWAQAMAGDIYLHGRGGAERDIEAGMGVTSLRLNKRLACTFADEVPVRRTPLLGADPVTVLDPSNPPPLEWICPPITG